MYIIYINIIYLKLKGRLSNIQINSKYKDVSTGMCKDTNKGVVGVNMEIRGYLCVTDFYVSQALPVLKFMQRNEK